MGIMSENEKLIEWSAEWWLLLEHLLKALPDGNNSSDGNISIQIPQGRVIREVDNKEIGIHVIFSGWSKSSLNAHLFMFLRIVCLLMNYFCSCKFQLDFKSTHWSSMKIVSLIEITLNAFREDFIQDYQNRISEAWYIMRPGQEMEHLNT